jgi:serine/threonine-protein kinase
MEQQALAAAQARQPTSAAAPVGLEVESSSPARDNGAGTLRINSRPWAHVYVDGSPKGYTPVSALQVSAGTHRVQLINAGLQMTKTFEVYVRPGETVTRIEALDGQADKPEPSVAKTPLQAPEMSLL